MALTMAIYTCDGHAEINEVIQVGSTSSTRLNVLYLVDSDPFSMHSM